VRRLGEFGRASVAAALATALFALWSLLPASHGRTGVVVTDLATLGAAVTVAAVAAHASLSSGTRRRRVHLLLLAAAGGAWAVGQTVSGVYEVLLGADAPFPSLADLGFLAFAPLAGIATLMLPEAPPDARGRLRIALDGFLIGGALLFLSWPTVLGPAYAAGGETPLGAVVAVTYPFADVVLATIALSVVTRLPGRAKAQPVLLAFGLAGFVVADSGFAAMTMGGTYRSGVLTDTGWVAGAFLMALSALVPPAPEERAQADPGRSLSWLPYVPLAIAATVALWSGFARDGLDSASTVIGASVVSLVVARQVLGVSDNARLTRSLAVAMREAQEREEHFRSLVQESSDVLTICESDGTIRFISPALYTTFGYDFGDLVGTQLAALVHPEDAGRVKEEVADAIANGGTRRVECRYRHADGRWLHVEAVLTNHLAHPSIEGLVFNTRDVSERKALERQLTHQAFHDPLTGLANRELFRDRVHHALQLRKRTHSQLAVLFLDLDGFKAVNDTLGHSVGDALLREVSGRLRSVLREADTVARLGGDEFAVLLEEIEGLHVAQQIATRFLEELHTAFPLDGHEVFVGASIGVALAGYDEDVDEVLRNADLAMYRAKATGKNRCEVFEPDMHTAALERMEVENDLRHAVVRNELRLHYQPIVELDTGRLVGVEALLRWEHPTRGLVSPLDFITVAEESGLIVPIGRWVLTEACRQVARWQRETGTPLRLSVNISARQLQAPRLAEHVAKTLRSTGLRPSDLVLEITESMLVDDADRTIAKLHLLREIGVRLAIDDFGTGYSSLNYLRRLPVDILKIDRSFVMGIGSEAELTSLTTAIVGIGRDLGLETVAEGIEEVEQLDALRAMGCSFGQGYLYARPLPPADLTDIVMCGSLLLTPEAATA
jgi:diguanylate cyclase (GGDEF)-like protein/PAS domain S-box-containing protein